MTRMLLLIALVGLVVAAARIAARWLSSFERGTAGAGDRNATGRGRTRSRLSVEEACAVLGLESHASREEIVAAHRHLMQKVHPDAGGSEYLASQVNCARDVLLEHL